MQTQSMQTTITTITITGLLVEAARARARWWARGDKHALELESELLDVAAELRQRGPDRQGRTSGWKWWKLLNWLGGLDFLGGNLRSEYWR